jgi:uncharacterized OsmC-like protein
VVTIKPKTVVTQKLQGACPTHARTDVSVRDLSLTIDEPKERGGTNTGPSPTETLMSALIACTNVITHKIAAKHGIAIDAMSVDLEAKFDRRGVTLAEEIAVPFPEVTLTINLTSEASAAEIETLKSELAMFCPVSKVIREAGTRITEIWNVERPPPS